MIPDAAPSARSFRLRMMAAETGVENPKKIAIFGLPLR
jgi:hypothetical protein